MKQKELPQKTTTPPQKHKNNNNKKAKKPTPNQKTFKIFYKVSFIF